MKQILLLIFVLLSPLLYGQVASESSLNRVRISGQVALLSATNSNLTGGFFSLSPAARGQVTASYNGFAFTAMRNSDLQSLASAANLSLLIPAYTHSFGKYTITASAETYFFDQRKDLSLMAPGLMLTRKGAVNVEALVLYGATFDSPNNLLSQRLAFSKSYLGYTFRLIGWNVNWGTHRVAMAAEISKNLTDNLRFGVMGNLNHISDTDTTQKFGVVRLGYAF